MKKPLLDLIRFTQLHISNTTPDDIVKLIQEFVQSLCDDLDSPTALEKLEKICLLVQNGKSINQNDFTRICNMLGIKL